MTKAGNGGKVGYSSEIIGGGEIHRANVGGKVGGDVSFVHRGGKIGAARGEKSHANTEQSRRGEKDSVAISARLVS